MENWLNRTRNSTIWRLCKKNSRAYEPASHSWHLPNSSCSAPSPEAFHGLLGLSLHFLLVGNAVCNSLGAQDMRRSSLTECCRTDRLLRELQSKDRDLWSSFVTVDDGVSVVDSPSDIPRPRCRETSDVLGRRPSGGATLPKSRSPVCEPEGRSSAVLMWLLDHFPSYCLGTSATKSD